MVRQVQCVWKLQSQKDGVEHVVACKEGQGPGGLRKLGKSRFLHHSVIETVDQHRSFG